MNQFIIYKITNLITQKVYIGQTTQSIEDRWYQHNHKSLKLNTKLARSLVKHGVENFKIEEIDGANSQSELDYKEWLYIYKFNSLSPNGYNLKEGGSTGKLTLETRNKISNTLKGRKITPEQSRKQTEAIQSRFKNNGPHKNSITAMRDHTDSLKKPIRCVLCGIEYASVSEASKIMNVTTSNICKNLKNKISRVRGCNFTYHNDNNKYTDMCRKKGKKVLFMDNTTQEIVIGYKPLSEKIGLSVDQINYRLNVKGDYSILSKHNISIIKE